MGWSYYGRKSYKLGTRAINIHSELIERAKIGDAQFDLYKKYNGAMYNAALYITHNVSIVENVLQEAFLNAFRSLSYYREDALFGSWLKRIVINKAISKKESKLEFVDKETDFDQVDVKDEPMDYNVEAVKRAIEDLPAGF